MAREPFGVLAVHRILGCKNLHLSPMIISLFTKSLEFETPNFFPISSGRWSNFTAGMVYRNESVTKTSSECLLPRQSTTSICPEKPFSVRLTPKLLIVICFGLSLRPSLRRRCWGWSGARVFAQLHNAMCAAKCCSVAAICQCFLTTSGIA